MERSTQLATRSNSRWASSNTSARRMVRSRSLMAFTNHPSVAELQAQAIKSRPTVVITPPQQTTVAFISGTSSTARSTLQGLLHTNLPPSIRLHALTRPERSAAQHDVSIMDQCADLSVLDDMATLERALSGASTIYCHTLSSSDTNHNTTDDANIKSRAQRLARAAAVAGVQHIVYNSPAGAAGQDTHRQVEDILACAGVALTALRPAVLMEEFWRGYTRPAVLQDLSFISSLPPTTKLSLVAARDIGWVLGHVLRAPEGYKNQVVELAGEEMTPAEMCATLTRAKPIHTRHLQPPSSMMSFALMASDVHRLRCMLEEQARISLVDVAGLRDQFPGMLTFEQFLTTTRWSDPLNTHSH